MYDYEAWSRRVAVQLSYIQDCRVTLTSRRCLGSVIRWAHVLLCTCNPYLCTLGWICNNSPTLSNGSHFHVSNVIGQLLYQQGYSMRYIYLCPVHHHPRRHSTRFAILNSSSYPLKHMIQKHMTENTRMYFRQDFECDVSSLSFYVEPMFHHRAVRSRWRRRRK